jgi:hypothetical protein
MARSVLGPMAPSNAAWGDTLTGQAAWLACTCRLYSLCNMRAACAEGLARTHAAGQGVHGATGHAWGCMGSKHHAHARAQAHLTDGEARQPSQRRRAEGLQDPVILQGIATNDQQRQVAHARPPHQSVAQLVAMEPLVGAEAVWAPRACHDHDSSVHPLAHGLAHAPQRALAAVLQPLPQPLVPQIG